MRKNAKPIDNNIKTKKATVDKLGLDIIGILVIGVGVVMLFSLFSLKMGIIGEIINGTTFSLMGFGGYFFPLFIIGSGIILLMERFDRIQLRILVALIIIFLSFLIVLDGINMDSSSLIDRIKSGLELSRANRGGGVLGSFFGFFFYKLFGSVGTYVVLAFSITASLLIITNLTVKEVLGKARSIKVIKPVEQVKETAAKKQAPVNPDRFLEEKTEVIRISDYTKNQQHPDGIEKEKKESLPKIPKDQLVKEAQTIDSEIKEKQEKVVKIYYKTPPISLLQSPAPKAEGNNRKDILNNARIIEETMRNFGIEATVSHINVGPTITCYELSPAPGIKLSRIVSLSDNISLSLASSDIRIEAPIPGKAAVGIEVPNKTKDMVLFKELIQSKEFADSKSDIPLVLGKDITGNVVISTIDKMPHLLIAGATGSGKSVCINTIIMGLLYKSSPEDLKMLLIDPKVVELSVYNGIPHLLIPVVTDAKKSAFALNWAVGEMERRYKLFAKSNVRDIQSYNEKHSTDGDKLPKILIIIDELADLMMVAAQEIEDYIARLAQMARAAGMYLIVAT
ncbi:MAG TPA: cell division protein FtsK, partial [Tissierellales bacterium]|nr:cell division protein FtsK [Tissierellales bacterium]